MANDQSGSGVETLGRSTATSYDGDLLARRRCRLAEHQAARIFMDIIGQEPDICIRYWRMFDGHVAVGRLIRRELIEQVPALPHLEYRMLFYALPGHEWRVDAMLTLLNEPGAWSDGRERRFGKLLGYEEWQIDYWLTHRRTPADP